MKSIPVGESKARPTRVVQVSRQPGLLGLPFLYDLVGGDMPRLKGNSGALIDQYKVLFGCGMARKCRDGVYRQPKKMMYIPGDLSEMGKKGSYFPESFSAGRKCKICGAVISRYNPADRCSHHNKLKLVW